MFQITHINHKLNQTLCVETPQVYLEYICTSSTCMEDKTGHWRKALYLSALTIICSKKRELQQILFSHFSILYYEQFKLESDIIKSVSFKISVLAQGMLFLPLNCFLTVFLSTFNLHCPCFSQAFIAPSVISSLNATVCICYCYLSPSHCCSIILFCWFIHYSLHSKSIRWKRRGRGRYRRKKKGRELLGTTLPGFRDSNPPWLRLSERPWDPKPLRRQSLSPWQEHHLFPLYFILSGPQCMTG